MTIPKEYRTEDQLHLSNSGNVLLIASERSRLAIDPDMNLSLDAGFPVMLRTTRAPLVVRSGNRKTALKWSDAGHRETAQERFASAAGWRIHFSDFHKDGISYDFELEIFIALDFLTDEIRIEINPREEGRDSVCMLNYPGGFVGMDAAVVPFMQGIRIPKKWPQEISHYPGDADFALCYGRSLYMPWIGMESGNSAAMLILDTPEDAGIRLRHHPGGKTLLETVFVSSLGKLRYPRHCRIRTFRRGNYVTLAKSYRNFIMDRGKFVSLREKAARNPKVEKLRGGCLLHAGLWYHYEPESIYYKPGRPEENDVVISCREFAEKFARLKRLGVRNLCIHLDGWGNRGYDNLEPDSIPVNRRCGGLRGLKRLASLCHDCGWLFTLHQQYRDSYLDAEGFDPRRLVCNEDGGHTFEEIWAGGKAGVLCPEYSEWYLRRNHAYFARSGLPLDGAYLDVFAVCPPDECFDRAHRVSRRKCLELRARCFDFVRSRWGVVSSEEPGDWAVPHLDLVHHAPWPLYPNPGEGPVFGQPLPLFNLVYHDAIVVPWSSRRIRGDWGHDKSSIPYLSGLLNAGIPYVALDADAADISALKVMSRLNDRTFYSEMSSHEYLEEDGSVQRAAYASGSVVTINHNTGAYEIREGGKSCHGRMD